jgi:purine-nucleoside phosphorylase
LDQGVRTAPDRDGWMDLLGLDEDEVPRLVVLESTWWRQDALDRRLPALADARELGVPDLWHGWHGDVPVAYGVAYGAPQAVERVHALGVCGTPVVAHLASAGSLSPALRIGDIVLPESAVIDEGASQYYGQTGSAPANLGKVARAAALLAPRGSYAHRGSAVTTSALFAMPPKQLKAWQQAGHLAVDLEASAVFSSAAAFGMRAVSLLYVWDALPRRPLTEDFSDEEREAQERAAEQVWQVALQLA